MLRLAADTVTVKRIDGEQTVRQTQQQSKGEKNKNMATV